MEEFTRENRYIVLKRKDVRGTLTPEELGQLNSVCDRIEEQRRLLAKPKLRCVVVESDWKIYNEVWALVQQESEGTLPQQSLYERLANQVADLKREKGGLQLELEAARKDVEKLRALYRAMREPMAMIGMDKHIGPFSDEAIALLDAMNAIDGGTYSKKVAGEAS